MFLDGEVTLWNSLPCLSDRMALPVCGKHVFILRLLGRFEQISRLSFLNGIYFY